MKRLLTLSAMALVLGCSAGAPPSPSSTKAAASSAPGFNVSGQINGKTGGKLYLYYGSKNPKEITLDATGHFAFRDTVEKESPGQYLLVDPTGMTLFKGGAMAGLRIVFFAQNGDDIKITGDQDNYKMSQVTGNVYNDQLMELNKAISEPLAKEDAIWAQVKAVMMERNPANRSKIDSMQNLTDPYESQITGIRKDFVSRHPDYLASATAMMGLRGKLPIDQLEKLYSSLSPQVKASPDGRDIAEMIGLGKAEQNNDVGKEAAAFTKKDRDGNTINLSDYKGKYVLLDFWGSWCGPCRASHPHLKELSKKYGAKGLVVIGIAEERSQDKTAWLKAIKEDGLTWTQIMNDEGKDKTNVVDLYGIKAFPTKILIDPQGKIVLRMEGTNVAANTAGHEPSNPAAGTASATRASTAAATGSSSQPGKEMNSAPLTELDRKLSEIFKD